MFSAVGKGVRGQCSIADPSGPVPEPLNHDDELMAILVIGRKSRWMLKVLRGSLSNSHSSPAANSWSPSGVCTIGLQIVPCGQILGSFLWVICPFSPLREILGTGRNSGRVPGAVQLAVPRSCPCIWPAIWPVPGQFYPQSQLTRHSDFSLFNRVEQFLELFLEPPFH